MAKSKLILITTLLFVGLLIILHFFYGLFTKYNYFTAKWDILSGKPRILQYGEPMMSDKEAISISPKFGFHYKIVAGCVVSTPERNGIEAYNLAITAYLDKKNGSSWKNRFDFQVDSLFLMDRKDTIKKVILAIDEVKKMSNDLESFSHGSRHINVFVLPQKKGQPNAWVGEIMSDSSIRVFYYYSVNPYTLEASRIHY